VLYPHQWNWDSAFTAIGNSYLAECAIEELEFLFDAKWNNGMLPQLVYANKKNKKEDTFFPLQNFMMRLGLQMCQDSQKIRNYITPIHAMSYFCCIFKNMVVKKEKGKRIPSRFLGHSKQPW
jgi:hypothetical protein